MSATEGEGVTMAAEQHHQQAGKPVKEKKTKTPKEKKPKSAKSSHPSHPPYFQMIKEALLVLHEKSGSSPYAIAKYMEEKHKAVLPANFKKMLALQLKNCAAKGKLIKIKASYKLSESDKKEKDAPKGAKRVMEKKTNKTELRAAVSSKAKTVKKPRTPKKTVKPAKVGSKKVKKSIPVKPRQPKSIKSPAAKKAKKAMA
ncbi:hypothetical protein HHK36_008609 [Tetracentron sinense]|uniref:H15 domain-containing protein n=1 Tax=Tetracentron sinense TaxID=13715 RepID=A0A834ZMX6_TETSI|nr:hypothetical protein HHK36_008609 [Tetracentron sinense]